MLGLYPEFIDKKNHGSFFDSQQAMIECWEIFRLKA